MNTEISKKPLGFWTLTALVSGTMIGSGIFLLPAQLAKLGSVSLLSWIVTTLGALFLGIILAKMSILVPRSGGPYAYARAGLGDFIGFQTAYTHWISLWVSTIALSLAMIGYLAIYFPLLLDPVNTVISALIVIWLLTIVNIFGVRGVGVVQVITTILKVLPILLIIVLGFAHFNQHIFVFSFHFQNQTAYSLISSAAGVTLWSFIGMEAATIPYNHIENPERNIPRATIIGILFASVIYILSSILMMGIIPANVLANVTMSPFVIVAQTYLGDVGKWILLAGAVISCFGCMNGAIFLQSQIVDAAAEDDLFPGVFAQKNRFGVPATGLILTALLQTILMLLTIHDDRSVQFTSIVVIASLAALIPYLYAAAAALILFKRQNILESMGKNIIYIAVAFLAAIYSFWIIMISGSQIILHGSFLIFIGVILYALICD